MTAKRIGLILGPLLFTLVMVFFHPEGLPSAGTAVLAGTAWMATWWITEAIPIAVTSMLPMVLFPLTGVLPIGETTAAFGHYLVFLFLGGFMLAMAFERWNLHRRIALATINFIGSNPRMIVLGAMLATALLSMWISNTATAVMMLPIAMAIARQLQDDPDTDVDENAAFGKALMLAIAYSASIGGMASLIGTPVNMVFVGQLETVYGVEIGFMEWFRIGFPVSVVLLFICWWYLTFVAFQLGSSNFSGGREEIRRLQKLQGPMTREEWKILLLFSATALAWITRKSLLDPLIPGISDTVIAMLGATLLFLIPGRERGEALLNWSEAVKLPWGVVLLLGGGFALAEGFSASGLADYIAGNLSIPEGVGLLVVILVVVAAVNFLTEVTSNVATTSMLMPVLAAAAIPLGVHPYALMVPATLAATCAFMLPVATPPNAVVFGSGYLSIPDMVRAGFRMNVISIIIVTLASYFLLPLVWGFRLGVLPEWVGG
ncbi:SLC13 family permease [Neolewinella lacunae]|uniref:SLC13/DASS family transporter n=1 Tax=Neolewinella lacunae TaxID=1517758 RepID=A0A923PEE9_9BACT|nr:SLC13 family permease [Neolewinella lacunae]MBC6992588.1 SLC13/DASS family transporter [Neolewinella lacunae]MDN3634329.1 SLC13 family permease [Neolewinella lacunae]